jgi:hypothetical protein
VHYRLQALSGDGGRLAFSPRVSLILPSGRASRGLGNGSPGWELNLPFSQQMGDLYLHWNAGFTHLPAATIGGTEYNLVTPRVAASGIWRVRPLVNVMLEGVVEWDETVTGPGSSQRMTGVTVVPGLRTGWNLGDAQTILGIGVPVLFADGARDAGVFLYFSHELPFARR